MNIDFKSYIEEFTRLSLAEDVKGGDHTSLSTIPEEVVEEAVFLAKESGVLAGVEVAREMWAVIDPEIECSVFIKDGQEVEAGDEVMRIKGSAHSILKGERLILNVMQRMSGISSKTKRYVDEIRHTRAKVLDTRKTTPLLRPLEKKAVELGGGKNHRFGLYDMILIKDNHVDYAGGIEEALSKTYAYLTAKEMAIPVEIEVRDFEELEEVLAFGKVDRIMLDNFTPEEVKKAVQKIGGKHETEASGGITLETIRAYAEAGVDFISVGDLTHSVKSLDISLKAVR